MNSPEPTAVAFESVMPCRAISWYCDRENEDCLADAPIEALKAIAEWIKEKE